MKIIRRSGVAMQMDRLKLSGFQLLDLIEASSIGSGQGFGPMVDTVALHLVKDLGQVIGPHARSRPSP